MKGFCEIALTKGQTAIISSEDYERVSKHRWCADFHPDTGKYYAIAMMKKDDGKNTTTRLHRFILSAKKGQIVDHINHDTLDNRRENLRFVTASESVYNRNYKKENKGVCKMPTSGRYRARVIKERKVVYNSYHDTPEEAKMAYDKAVLLYHGEFATTK